MATKRKSNTQEAMSKVAAPGRTEVADLLEIDVEEARDAVAASPKANAIDIPVPHNSTYSVEDRRLAAFLYMIYGTMKMAAYKAGIPRETVRDWAKQEWWDEVVNSYRIERAEELDAGFSNIVHGATDAILDRIRYGEEVITKTGQKIRKMLGARDLAMVLGVVFDKRQIVRNAPTSIKGNSEADLQKFASDLMKSTEASINSRKDSERRKAAAELLDEVSKQSLQGKDEEQDNGTE